MARFNGVDYMHIDSLFSEQELLVRQTARRFVDVMLQTAKWANAHHPESAAILAKYVGMTADAIQSSPRAVYGEKPIQPAMIQPVLDFSSKYIGLDKTSAASLIWRA